MLTAEEIAKYLPDGKYCVDIPFETLSSESSSTVLYHEVCFYRKQMMINYSYAENCDKALQEIAGLLGWKPDTGPCMGCPPPDINEIAVQLVRESIENRSKI